MKKKQIFLIATVILLAITVAGSYVYYTNSKEPKTMAEAIIQAQNYKPEGVCLTVMTTAIHRKTGAIYEFGSSCIPDGWTYYAR